jgi:hypothetical protein
MRPTAADKTVSGLLIGLATTLIGAAIFVAPSLMDKVSSIGLIIGFVMTVIGLIALAASIVAGGRGMTKGASAGPNNAFDLQSKLLIVGFGLLVLTAGAALILPQPKQEKPSDDVSKLQARLSSLESRVAGLEQRAARQAPAREALTPGQTALQQPAASRSNEPAQEAPKTGGPR